MALHIQQRAQAFSSGANLWLLPEKDICQLTRKVDWHLGFKIEKAKHHHSQELSPELQDRLRTEGLIPDKFNTSSSEAPLMVVSHGNLPADLVVCIPKDKDLSAWITNCEKVWTELGRPKVRVFLPDGIQSEVFRKSWAHTEDPNEIYLVESL
jgi:hypothetical protein